MLCTTFDKKDIKILPTAETPAPKHHRFAGFPLGRNLASVFPFGLFFRRFGGLQAKGSGGASTKEGRRAFTPIRLGTVDDIFYC